MWLLKQLMIAVRRWLTDVMGVENVSECSDKGGWLDAVTNQGESRAKDDDGERMDGLKR